MSAEDNQRNSLEVLSHRINILRSDSKNNRLQAAGLLGGAAVAGLATVTGEVGILIGAPLVLGGTHFGFKRAAESRDSATEAAMLLALHQYDMVSKMDNSGEAPQHPPAQPQ